MSILANDSPKEHPILFSTPMVQAILDGRKTQTRRVAKVASNAISVAHNGLGWAQYDTELNDKKRFNMGFLTCPYGKKGNRLWVRESFRECQKKIGPYGLEQNIDYEFSHYEYKADNPDGKWKPSIFMPRSACRILLEITGVRIERLQDISEKDAIAEGITEALSEDTLSGCPIDCSLYVLL